MGRSVCRIRTLNGGSLQNSPVLLRTFRVAVTCLLVQAVQHGVFQTGALLQLAGGSPFAGQADAFLLLPPGQDLRIRAS